jgi:hypothetical protein
VTQLCYEVDVEPYAKARDATVAELAEKAGVLVSPHISHTLYVSTCLQLLNTTCATVFHFRMHLATSKLHQGPVTRRTRAIAIAAGLEVQQAHLVLQPC